MQCWDSGKLLVSGQPSNEAEANAWGMRAIRHKIRLPRRVHARSAQALLTLHGQLYIRVFCEPAAAEPEAGDAAAAKSMENLPKENQPEATGEAAPAGGVGEVTAASRDEAGSAGVGEPSSEPAKETAAEADVQNGNGGVASAEASPPAVSGEGAHGANGSIAPDAQPPAVPEPAEAQ